MNFEKISGRFIRSTEENLNNIINKDGKKFMCAIVHTNYQGLTLKILELKKKDNIYYWVDPSVDIVYNNLWTSYITDGSLGEPMVFRAVVGFSEYTDEINDKHFWKLVTNIDEMRTKD